MIITYAQGLALLAKASDTYHYKLNPETVAQIWRGGCIIRAALLEEIRSAYKLNPALEMVQIDGAYPPVQQHVVYLGNFVTGMG